MELKFSKQEIIGMISRYFKDHENKDVLVSVSSGKVIRVKKHLPVCGVVQFDVKEPIQNMDGKIVFENIPLVDDMFEKIISTVLSEASFDVESLSFNSDPRDGITFTGITVVGNKKDLGEKKI